MAPRRKKSFATGPITSHLRLLFRRFRQGPVRKPLGPDESRIIVVDIDHASRTVDASVDAESQPQGVVLQVQSLLPPECPKLNPGDVVIHGDRPARAGSFADVWDGTLDGVRVVIKSYRLYSTADPTHPCMVGSCCHCKVFCSPSLPSVTEALRGSSGLLPPFTSQHRPVPRCVHHPGTPTSSGIRFHATPVP